LFRTPKFEKLLEPFQIRQVKLRNRMVKAPQSMNFCAEDGSVNDRIKGFYEALARGGIGLIISGGTAVDYPLGYTSARVLLSNDDKFIAGLSELAQVIHKYGCPTFLQISHAGPAMPSNSFGGIQPVAASSLSKDEKPLPSQDLARALSIPEIKVIISYFVNAADRAKKAGFDGIEIHGAHNYLINSFLSRAWNKRQDAYGCQNMENRTRFLVEIIQGVKERVGEDFPVGVRFNGKEWGIKNGITSEESVEFTKIFQKNGADYLHVSGFGIGLYNDVRFPEMLLYPEPEVPLSRKVKTGALVPEAEAIKKAVSIPVIAVGRLDAELGERILREGKADLIALGRRLVADPELPNKIAAGRLEDIAPCTACLECVNRIRRTEPARCRINAALGKEREYAIEPAEKKKKIMVVGGGPAGMEAARVTALRGHEVVLYEREPKLGGLLPIAAVVKGTEIEDLPSIIRYLKTQIIKLGVKINLGREVDLLLIDKIKPDVIIIATGGMAASPEISGINNSNVINTLKLYRLLKFYLRFLSPSVLRWLTKFWMPIGKKVVIMGGAIQGCELAEFLVKRGRMVTIVETSDKLGNGIATQHIERLIPWLAKKGVIVITEASYKELTDRGLTIVTKGGEEQIIEGDTIFSAMSLKPNNEFFKALEGKAPEIYMIGDCREASLITDAIDDGSRIGIAI